MTTFSKAEMLGGIRHGICTGHENTDGSGGQNVDGTPAYVTQSGRHYTAH